METIKEEVSKQFQQQNLDHSKWFECVELSNEEVQIALNNAKKEKYRVLEANRKREEYDNNLKKLREPWNAEQLEQFVLNKAKLKLLNGKEIEFNGNAKEVFKLLCLYFSKDKLFEKNGYSLSKGICLVGNVGVGKTTMMRMFSANKFQSYNVISCRLVADKFADLGHEVLHQFSNPISPINPQDYFLQTKIGTCFDDLGTESNKQNFGNKVNPMENVILNRYDNREIPWNFTHITTNLNAEMIEEIYGCRVRSRMREMFNVIQLKGNDLRK